MASGSDRDTHLKMVGRVYESVVSDVMRSCREAFLEEGIDADILNVLRSHWELRIRKAGSVPFYGLNESRTVVSVRIKREGTPESQTPEIRVVVPRVATERHGDRLRQELVVLANEVRSKNIPDAEAKWLIETKLEDIFGAEEIAQLDGGMYDSSDDSDSDDSDLSGSPKAKRSKPDGSAKQTNGKSQTSEDSASSSSSDEAQEEEDEDENPEPALNSDDDLSDMDPELVFDTDNLCICLYNVVKEGKKGNDWSVGLKNGVMNMNGLDYVFKEMTGSAGWL